MCLNAFVQCLLFGVYLNCVFGGLKQTNENTMYWLFFYSVRKNSTGLFILATNIVTLMHMCV